MRFLAFILLFIACASSAHAADAINGRCRAQATKKALDAERRRSPGLPEAQLKQRLNDGMASYLSARYIFESQVRECILSYAKADFIGPKIPTQHCPASKTNYRISCLREWISKQKLGYASEAEMITDIVIAVTKIDLQDKTLNHDSIRPMSWDAALLGVEKVSRANNIVFNPAPPSQGQEQAQLQKTEKQKYVTMKKDFLAAMTPKFSTAKENAKRMPAGDNKKWLEDYVKKLEARAAKLKNQRF